MYCPESIVRSSERNSSPPLSAKTSRFKTVLAGLLLLAMVLALYFSPLQDWLKQTDQVRDMLALTGGAAPYIFTAGTALLVALGMPRLLLCLLAGSLFGWIYAIVITQIGTVLGAYLTFLFFRHFGSRFAARENSRLRSWSEPLLKRGLLAVLLIRQLPINGLTNDLFLGLSPVSHSNFLLGTFIGFLPQGLAACLMGAGMLQTDLRTVSYYALAALLVYFLAQWLRAKMMHIKSTDLLDPG